MTDVSTARPYYLWIAAFTAVGVLAIDLQAPLKLATGVLYAMVVWLAFIGRSRRGVQISAVAGAALALAVAVWRPQEVWLWPAAKFLLSWVAILAVALPSLKSIDLLAKETQRDRSDIEREGELEQRREQDLRRSRAMSSVLEDLQQERAKLLKVSQEGKQLAEIVESSDDGIISTSLDGVVTSWNSGAERLYGYSAAEMLGKSIARLRIEDGPRDAPELLPRLLRGEVVDHFETVRMCKDGSLRNVSLTVSLMRDSNHQPVGAASIARDVSDRKRLEEAQRTLNQELERRVNERTSDLAEANEALEQSNMDLEQFAYLASHDLQTPLRSISSFARFLQKDYTDRLDHRADQYIVRIVRSAERLRELISDMLELARVGSRAAPFERIELNQSVDEALELLQVPIEDVQAKVSRDDLPAVVGDRAQLGQLVLNLINNAIKYHADDAPCVHVSATRDDGSWRVAVEDNGIGIAPEFHESVFDTLRRLHSQDKYPGTGIGLAICRRIVERHGGKIWVESEEGEGSTFFFSVPGVEQLASGELSTAS